MDLHDARNSGFSVGSIPPSEIHAWLDLKGITDPAVRQDFARVIRLADRQYLSRYADWKQEGADESQEPDSEADSAPESPKRRGRRGKRK